MPCFTLFKGIIDCRHGLVQGGLLMPVLWLALAAQNLRTGQAEGGGGLGCSQNTVPVDFHLKARL